MMNPFRSLFKQAEPVEDDNSNKINVGKTNYKITLKSTSEFRPGETMVWTLIGTATSYILNTSHSQFLDVLKESKSGLVEFDQGIYVPVSDVKCISAIHEDHWIPRPRSPWRS